MPDAATAVTKQCPMCGTLETNVFPTAGYLAWQRGMLIQKAMPTVNECLREFLITGHCENCRAEVDAMFADLEQAEEDEFNAHPNE